VDSEELEDLLEYIQSRSLSSCNSIKTFDFSTLYTTISHSKLKDKLRELVQLCFIKKNDQRRYKYLVLGRDRSYFVKHHSDSTKKFTEIRVITKLPNSEQSYKGKVKTHKYINRQNQSTTGKL
jgi:hypothetical protein